MGKRIVIALGGNALGKNLPEQMLAVKETSKAIADLVEAGHTVVVAHGNGPQVGMIQNAFAAYCRQEPSADVMPLSMCVAMSQGYIGYDLQNALKEELLNRGLQQGVATVLTQVVVDGNDPAFQHPTKPIGAFMSKEEAEKMAREKGWHVAEDAGRGWRQVVASPKPLAVVELTTIRALAEADNVVIACGGGGIPVIATDHHHLKGAAAVIDKDSRLGAAGGASGCRYAHHPHRRGKGGGELQQAEPEMAGCPDAGGSPHLYRRGAVRSRLHASKGGSRRQICGIQARPHRPHHPVGKGPGRHRR